MSIKIITLCSIFAIAFGSTLPGSNLDRYNDLQSYLEKMPYEENEVLLRNVRSPQRGRFEARQEYSSRNGDTSSIKYTQPLSDNFDVYYGASKNFKNNDKSGHVGFTYKF